jgi:hypothetical protein
VRGRRIGVALLLVLGTLFWAGLGLGIWAKRQALDTNNWVTTSSRLLENERIRTALGLYLVDSLYGSAAVEDRLREVLPPRLDRLAAPAAAGLKEVARRNAPRLLGSAAALDAWRSANRAAHDTLLKVVRSDIADRDISLDLKDLVRKVAEGTGLPAGVADKIPPDVGRLEIVPPNALTSAKTILDVLETVAYLMLALAIAAFGGAILLSPDRRRTTLTVGACIVLAAVLLLALRRLGGNWVVDAIADAPNAKAVAHDAWNIATRLMVDIAQGSILLGLFVVTGAWLAGMGRRATALRRSLAPAFRERPGVVRAGPGAAILLLVIWGPVPWTQKPLAILIFTVAAFVWLERVRAHAVEEFPDVPAGEWSRRARAGMASLRARRAEPADRVASLERLAALRDSGVLDEAEFQREKAALLTPTRA